MTFDEMTELNSVCVICGRIKFEPAVTYSAGSDPEYSLVRCKKKDCDKHCQFNHEVRMVLPDGREDLVEIASGWGSH